MRRIQLLAAIAMLAPPFAARADDQTPHWYLAGMASHVQPDSGRDMRNGLGGAAVFGKPLGGGFSIEADVFGQSFRRHDEDASGSKVYGAGIDLAFLPHRGKGLPFVLAGGGAAHEDGFAPYVRAGIGFHVPNFYEGFSGPLSTRRSTWSLRVDLSWYGTFTDRVNAGETRLDDVRLNIGFQFNRVEPRATPPRISTPPTPPVISAPPKAPAPAEPAPPPEEIQIVPPVDWYITHPKGRQQQ